MSHGIKRIKLAFNFNLNSKWMGGVNYYKNLFHALNFYEDKIIDPIWYYNRNSEEWITKELGRIITSKRKNYLLSNKMVRNFLKSILSIDSDILYFKKEKIKIISHSTFSGNSFGIKKVNWIPDFQHLHLPEMFTAEEIKHRDNQYTLTANNSDLVLLSSNDAYNDFITMFPKCADKARVLNFVSYISPAIYSENLALSLAVYNKTNCKKYFYVPNQLWKHKNHIIILKAFNLLKKSGFTDIKIIFSGYIKDYRNGNYYNEIINYIENNNLKENITILGLIDDETVKYLMRNSVSVINPSLFEGWSSTVEEAKSIGKNLILSDLPVHREQNPPESVYFNSNNENELANILLSKWQASNGGPDYLLEEIARKSMIERMINFGKNYEKYLLELF